MVTEAIRSRMVWVITGVLALLVLLALLALLVLGRRGRRRPEPRRGCGCSPLSWLMSLLGINVILDAFRRRP